MTMETCNIICSISVAVVIFGFIVGLCCDLWERYDHKRTMKWIESERQRKK